MNYAKEVRNSRRWAKVIRIMGILWFVIAAIEFVGGFFAPILFFWAMLMAGYGWLNYFILAKTEDEIADRWERFEKGDFSW